MIADEPSRTGLSGSSRGTQIGGGLGPTVAAAVFLVHGWLLYGSTGRDDVHITYWAAHSLLEQGEILNYNAIPYEQSSSLLHTLLLAATGQVTSLPLPVLGPLISIGAGLFTLWLVYRLALRLEIRRPAYAPLLTALLGYFVHWSFSGMETTVAAALVVASVLSVHRWLEDGGGRSALASGGVLAGFVAVRPESGLVLTAALIGYMVARRLRGGPGPERLTPRELAAVVGGLLIFGAVTLWRFSHFGMLVPGPVAAKVPGVEASRILGGLAYLLDHGWDASIVGLALAGTAGLIAAWRRKGRVVRLCGLTLGFVLAYLGFAVTSGGDWMEGGRFLVPALPLLVVLAVKGLEFLSRGRRAVTGALTVLLTVGSVAFGARSSVGFPGPIAERGYGPVLERIGASDAGFSWWEKANRVHLGKIPTILAMENLMRRVPRARDRLTVWSVQAGMVFYHLARRHADRFEFVDLVGLTTPHLHGCPMLRGERATPVGLLRPSYGSFLARRSQLKRQCGVPLPDIVVDLVRSGREISALRQHGFRIAYRQKATIEPAFGFLGAPEVADAFIAVREGIVEGGSGPPRVFHWP